MTAQIQHSIKWASESVQAHSDSAKLDAELLLAFCLQKPRSYLYTWPEEVLSSESLAQFEALVQRRKDGAPIAYLLGNREFYSLDFDCTEAALIPRPETELLVDMALKHCPDDKPLKILELGSGTGIIAITLKKYRPMAKITACDIDPASLALAKQNAAKHQVDINFILSDWYDDIDTAECFDLIVSNPPYIAGNHPFLQLGDLPAEPQHALSPGASGLEAICTIIQQANQHLKEGCYLMLEHGYDQQTAVARLFTDNGFCDIDCQLDDNHLPRVSFAKLNELANSLKIQHTKASNEKRS